MLQFPCLLGPQDLQDVEILLHHAAQYYESYFSSEENFGKPELLRWQPFFGKSLLDDMIDQYVIACRNASRSFYKIARIHLDRACRHVHLAMLAQHSRLLGIIFEIIQTRSWNVDFDTAELFGWFVADMSMTIHGESHPITRSIRRFCRSTAPKDKFLAAFDQLRLTSAIQILGDTHCETINLKIALCYGLKEDKKRLETLMAEALETAESNYGPLATKTLRALLDRAEFYLLGIHDLDMAELEFMEVLRRCQESSTDIETTYSRLKALKGLMGVAQNRGSYVVKP